LAQFIGASREHVTPVLGELRAKQLMCLRGSTLLIMNRAACCKTLVGLNIARNDLRKLRHDIGPAKL
jgi:hypothetical protein